MPPSPSLSPLTNLEAIPYITPEGQLPEQLQGQVGVYAIFDQDNVLQFIGYSRDIYLSLQQHLVRQPQNCYWLKAQTIERPNRTILEEIREAWIRENGVTPPGNEPDQTGWTQPIDAKITMTPEEQAAYARGDEITQMKLLKQVARRVEEKILADLRDRGLQLQIRFNPKLKEMGLLDLK
ncbi:Nuclease subunit of the excinuclease complex [Leptolyngbya sp. 'hensonii']|uniref:GIY-YIG nuclease family protein n=1 Tax=Leptolyngbya sp. 'hensonii' TaxID=1922337 RepID=UPI00094FFDDA|nr:GIY-YIG nuclease family protein [Leptolyngbya sp. 'hensonii']OLP19679.1 Nuclease subunit of the excinuclease complex [Leptolyngbya sp. 'hensonii']